MCNIGNKWSELIANDTEFDVSVLAIAEKWLTKIDHMPRTASLNFCIYNRDGNNECQGAEWAIPSEMGSTLLNPGSSYSLETASMRSHSINSTWAGQRGLIVHGPSF